MKERVNPISVPYGSRCCAVPTLKKTLLCGEIVKPLNIYDSEGSDEGCLRASDPVGSGLRAAGIGGNEATRAKHGVTAGDLERGREAKASSGGTARPAGGVAGGAGASTRFGEATSDPGRLLWARCGCERCSGPGAAVASSGDGDAGRLRGGGAAQRLGSIRVGVLPHGDGFVEIVEQRCEETRSGDGWARASRIVATTGTSDLRARWSSGEAERGETEGAVAASGKGSGVVSGAGSRLHEGKVVGRRGTDSCGSSPGGTNQRGCGGEPVAEDRVAAAVAMEQGRLRKNKAGGSGEGSLQLRFRRGVSAGAGSGGVGTPSGGDRWKRGNAGEARGHGRGDLGAGEAKVASGGVGRHGDRAAASRAERGLRRVSARQRRIRAGYVGKGAAARGVVDGCSGGFERRGDAGRLRRWRCGTATPGSIRVGVLPHGGGFVGSWSNGARRLGAVMVGAGIADRGYRRDLGSAGAVVFGRGGTRRDQRSGGAVGERQRRRERRRVAASRGEGRLGIGARTPMDRRFGGTN
ncbi:spidroin-1-like [Eucalyptus grandis]|uniref:spidroin-1-like n=1 Tax=Eucalyptus grandis TaxID=71139 RepID=UPI00192ED7BA|nr:spidroin-1-like [Eucalyptus grandis]